MAEKHGIRLEHLDYVQIHPTTLYSEKPGRRFLISESVRGEGALLYNKKGERFVDELLPRDVVTNAIRKQMEQTAQIMYAVFRADSKGNDFKPFPQYLSAVPGGGLRCDEGVDSGGSGPALLYGGIWVDSESRTTMDRLYAVGRPAATASTEPTVWPAIPCWRALCSPREPQAT